MRRRNFKWIVVAGILAAGLNTTARAQAKPSAAVLAAGQSVYETNCLACHQADGSGVPYMNPPLVGTSVILGDKKKLISIILKGLSDTSIDGKNYSNPMPALDYLSDKDISDVLTYVRNSFGNKADAVSVPEVKAVRSERQ